jgi:8-oxo-dGTP pyrophosphatase MutT (NUDIX family)
MARIRPLALALVIDGRRLLVETGTDTAKGERFFRLLGGGIEFGETGEQALRRELLEEIGAEVAEAEYLETLENIFTYLGDPGHELCRVYRVRFAEQRLYERDEFERLDQDPGEERTLWMRVEPFLDHAERIYPDGVVELLERMLDA